jgi:predicted transcriptional regulator
MDIVYSMLMVVNRCNPGALPTHILYGSNLSYDLFKSYLAVLLKSELMREKRVGSKMVYDITDKGKEFLRTYERMRGLLIGQAEL